MGSGDRNATHIHHLPVEILLAIFEYAALDDRPMGESLVSSEIGWATASRRDPSTSVNISHVCHRWRLVALSHRTLWARVPRLHDNWTDAYLSRSPTLLDVEIRPEHFLDATEERDMMLLYIISRARSLSISFSSEMLPVSQKDYSVPSKFLRVLKTSQAPYLEELRFVLRRPKDVVHALVQGPFKPFGDQVLRSLHTAKFNYVFLDALAFQWPALRTLELDDCIAWQSVPGFVDLFVSLPLLEDFMFGQTIVMNAYMLREEVSENLPPLRSIPMTRLKSFILHGSYTDIFIALAVLAIPCGSLIKLTLADSNSPYWCTANISAKLRILRDALSSHFFHIPSGELPFHSLTFEGRTMSAVPQPGTRSRLPNDFILDVPKMYELGTLQTLQTHHALAHPVFSRAAHVELRPFLNQVTDPDYDHLEGIFDLFPSMQSLLLRGTELYDAFGSLVVESQLGDAPNLTVLRMVGVDFRSSCHSFLIDYLFRKLLRLAGRIELIELEQCTIHEHDMASPEPIFY
ncbi:hypothetical protein PENSPDRAFT_756702 [Peniophora sp. CONT]|nr:hypothetical protein PENSPDRAFT_756702 [Peniophora sp. CONT]